MVVDEQQRLTEQVKQQAQKIQELTATAEQAHEKLNIAEVRAQDDEQKASRLEIELQMLATKHHQEQEVMMAKLTNEDSQNRQLRLKLAALSRQIDELEETNKTLRKAEEELQDLRDKMNKGECGNSSLIAEVEELRKRVLEMEGKDEELIKMEDQCKELNKKLDKEAAQSKNLKVEVEKLNKRITDLEKLEDAFSKSKQECHQLKCNIEKEKAITKQMLNEIESLKVRVRELEAIEAKLEKTEFTLKEDLTKLKTLTVMLVDERKTMTEKIKQTEDKFHVATAQLQAEQNKVTAVTEKLIEESKKVLKSENDQQDKIYSVTKEKDDLKSKLNAEQSRANDLLSNFNMLKKRVQALEAIEKEFLKSKLKQENTKSSAAVNLENNKIKELSQEVERLKHTLKTMKAVEDDLMKTEDEFESLEQRYLNEQHKAKCLSEELEEVKRELVKYKRAENSDCNQDQLLFKKLKEEEAKSGHLSREIDALKEKIHEYMSTEEKICRLEGDHSNLQKKLTQQENRNRELAREMESLSKELERYRRFSKSLRPSLNGRRISDLQVFSKEVQTDPADNKPPDYKTLVPLEKAVINGQLYEESDTEDEDTTDEEQPLPYKCNSSMTNPANRKLWMPWMKSRESQSQNEKFNKKQNGNYVQPGDLVLSHTPGQPLHIKVTPDHGQNTATLEITSPTAENTHSYTSTAVIPNCGTPKQRITIFQNGSLTPIKPKVVDGYKNQEQVRPPLSRSCSTRTRTPDSCGSITPERTMSPFQVLAVTGSPEQVFSPEPMETGGSHTVFRVSPERQTGWQFQRSNSYGSTPSVITTEDNKIHIHLGRPISPCSPVPDNKTATLSNGMPSRSPNKITSSITITPTATPLPRQSQITVNEDVIQQLATPTRIPKPKSVSATRLPVKTQTPRLRIPDQERNTGKQCVIRNVSSKINIQTGRKNNQSKFENNQFL